QYLGACLTSWYEWDGKEGFSLYNGGQLTPAYKACKVYIAELSGYKLSKRIDTAQPRDFVLQFTNPQGGTKLVGWTAPPPMQSPDQTVPHDITIPVQAAAAQLPLTQIYGEKSTVPVAMGAIKVNLTGAPQYITLK